MVCCNDGCRHVAFFGHRGGIHQHQSCNLLRKAARIVARVQTASRVPHENKRAVDAGLLEQSVQAAGDRVRDHRAAGGVAPAQTGPVIRAHACQPRQRCLHLSPDQKALGPARDKHHGG